MTGRKLMPVDLAVLAEPRHTAVLVLEMQNGLAGALAGDSAIARAVAEDGVAERCAGLLASARSAGALVVHCIKTERADGLGAKANAPMWRRRARVGFIPLVPGSLASAILAELGPQDGDLVVPRSRGVTAFGGTELDPLLRNLGVETVALCGISVNVGVIAAAADAVSCGYEVIVVRDAVAGAPRGYVEDVLSFSLAPLATLTDAASLQAAWKQTAN
jgi:nicotinamidase-related amidase